jgi:hypothetical protein
LKGAYLNENDWLEPNWEASFFGDAATYERLLAVKQAVDPNGMFTCHQCVGSTNDTQRSGGAAPAANNV